jgi:hypothetical protein
MAQWVTIFTMLGFKTTQYLMLTNNFSIFVSQHRNSFCVTNNRFYKIFVAVSCWWRQGWSQKTMFNLNWLICHCAGLESKGMVSTCVTLENMYFWNVIYTQHTPIGSYQLQIWGRQADRFFFTIRADGSRHL